MKTITTLCIVLAININANNIDTGTNKKTEEVKPQESSQKIDINAYRAQQLKDRELLIRERDRKSDKRVR